MVLECSGFYYYLSRNYCFDNDFCEALDACTNGDYSLLCVPHAPCGGHGDTGLHDKCCEVFCDFAAVVFMGGKK